MAPRPPEDYQTRPGAELLYRRARDTQEQSRSLAEEARRLRSQRRPSPPPVSRNELLACSPYARLVAQLETLPVIEQAKGILMAHSGISDAEAFALLRGASQRSNVPVRDLAARIVAAASGGPAAAKALRLIRRPPAATSSRQRR